MKKKKNQSKKRKSKRQSDAEFIRNCFLSALEKVWRRRVRQANKRRPN